jgi:hypothetical protein
MNWQDYTFLLGNIVFFVALIPAMRSRTDKPPILSSLLTATVLAGYAATFITLDLYRSAVGSALVASAWAILLVQQLVRRHRYLKTVNPVPPINRSAPPNRPTPRTSASENMNEFRGAMKDEASAFASAFAQPLSLAPCKVCRAMVLEDDTANLVMTNISNDPSVWARENEFYCATDHPPYDAVTFVRDNAHYFVRRECKKQNLTRLQYEYVECDADGVPLEELAADCVGVEVPVAENVKSARFHVAPSDGCPSCAPRKRAGQAGAGAKGRKKSK